MMTLTKCPICKKHNNILHKTEGNLYHALCVNCMKTFNNAEVVNCPFCKMNLLECWEEYDYSYVWCKRCNCFIQTDENVLSAIATWNRKSRAGYYCAQAVKNPNGKCEGYQKSDLDDEPAEICKECTDFELCEIE